MFFAPTILALLKRRPAIDVHVICLTPGHAVPRSHSRVRKLELHEVCSLGYFVFSIGSQSAHASAVMRTAGHTSRPRNSTSTFAHSRRSLLALEQTTGRPPYPQPCRVATYRHAAHLRRLWYLFLLCPFCSFFKIFLRLSGVSGHINHSSAFRGVRYLCEKQLLPTYTRTYILESVNIVRKYSGIVDAMVSYWLAQY